MRILKKIYIYPILVLAVCSITIVCASFSENMTIMGEAYLRVDEEIRITDLKMLSTNDSSFEKYNSKYSKNSTSMFVTLPQTTSTITYQVTIENKSNYVYVISDITDELINSEIIYTVDDYKIGQGLDRKSITTINITFKYKNGTSVLPSNIDQIANIYFKFERPQAIQLSYNNSISKTHCTDVQCALDELYELLGG